MRCPQKKLRKSIACGSRLMVITPLVMLPVNRCESNNFPLRRLRSKVVGVACETKVVGVSCTLLRFVYVTSLSLTYERGSNGTTTSNGSRELIRICSHNLRIFFF